MELAVPMLMVGDDTKETHIGWACLVGVLRFYYLFIFEKELKRSAVRNKTTIAAIIRPIKFIPCLVI